MVLKIRRRNSRFPLLFATVFGCVSGVYIWKPVIDQLRKENSTNKLTENEETKNPELKPLTRWEHFKMGMKNNFGRKSIYAIMILSAVVLYKWKLHPLVKRRKRDNAHLLMQDYYESQNLQKQHERFKFS